jgi:hypothetical protein
LLLGAWHGVARRGVASTIPGSTVFAVMVGVWEPEESRRKSDDINKKMIKCTWHKWWEIWWKSKQRIEGSFGILWETIKTTKTSKTTQTIKNHQI